MSEPNLSAPSLRNAITAATSDFRAAGLSFDDDTVRRFVASLIAKRFVILTGLSGSGKTRLAQAFAAWASHEKGSRPARFGPGARIKADRNTYLVSDADRLSVEFWNSDDPDEAIRVSLPWTLIDEWVNCIQRHDFTRSTPARTIRKLVDEEYGDYSRQLNSFETILKAAAFALLETEQREPAKKSYEVIAVGADWTSNENIVGYLDALHNGRYVRTTTLDLMLRAHDDPSHAYFLILDEMNLSHVERYFADFLSAMESDEPIFLHPGSADVDGVPPALTIPKNLFVVGTVNVDETTYVFSPKVLDRANTIEFRVNSGQIRNAYLHEEAFSLGLIVGHGSDHLGEFVKVANQPLPLLDSDRSVLASELSLLFEVLEDFGQEFGLRVAHEIARFVGALHCLSDDFDLLHAIDVQIYQKILPRLGGSRAQLEPVLLALAAFCSIQRNIDDVTSKTESVLDAARLAAADFDEAVVYSASDPTYPLSQAKIRRMHSRLKRNGFTSFAEA